MRARTAAIADRFLWGCHDCGPDDFKTSDDDAHKSEATLTPPWGLSRVRDGCPPFIRRSIFLRQQYRGGAPIRFRDHPNFRVVFQAVGRQESETVGHAEPILLYIVCTQLAPITLHMAADEASQVVTRLFNGGQGTGSGDQLSYI